MAVDTYTNLQAAIANFLARSDLTAQIPDFITMAEARMSRELETRSQEKRAAASTVGGNEYLSLPTDLREVREVKLNTSPLTVLSYYSPVALDEKFASSGQGKPLGYSIIGDEIKLRPIPDTAYSLEIVYIGTIDALSAANQTNNILSRSPDAYLYGALAEAYAYLLDEQRAAQYLQRFNLALEEIKIDEQRAHYGTGSLQMSSIYQRQKTAAES